ncbi:MAG: 4Fe-4S binding protein [Candidatus Omnitrophota bacterium]
MAKRKIIKIDEDKCTGCGLCVPNCPEGAIQIIDDKARLISDLFCDGLGACIGECPEGAISIEEREAEAYSEFKVMENIVKQGKNVIKAHLVHLKEHGETKLLDEAMGFLKENKIECPDFGEKAGHGAHGHACPGTKMMELAKRTKSTSKSTSKSASSGETTPSELGNWPIQINLVPPFAPYLDGADILIAADCVPFAYPDFHKDLLAGKVLLVGCPKLDDTALYKEKLSQILKQNAVKSITYAHMEVPCCFGMIGVLKDAISGSGKNIPFEEVTISVKGERL